MKNVFARYLIYIFGLSMKKTVLINSSTYIRPQKLRPELD